MLRVEDLQQLIVIRHINVGVYKVDFEILENVVILNTNIKKGQLGQLGIFGRREPKEEINK